jgi:hypothetical protein
MERTIDTGDAPELVIDCKADLEIRTHDTDSVVIESDDNRASISVDGNRIGIVAGDDTKIHAPHGAIVRIASANGDLDIEGFTGPVQVGHVGGDLKAEDVSEIDIHSVGGDCKLDDVHGFARIGSVGGDLEAEDVALHGMSLSVGGDISLRLITGLEPVSISAGGDVSVEFSDDANATISISDSEGVRRLQFGAGETAIKISAGGDVSVESDGDKGKRMRSDIESSINEAMRDVEREMQDMQRNFENMARDFSNRFSGMGIPGDRIERAQRQAEAAARKVEQKLAHRMRHLEEHARQQAERASQRASRAAEKAARRERDHDLRGRGFKFNFGFGNRANAPVPPMSPTPPAPPVPPSIVNKPFEPPPPNGATDEERLLILRMLQEKKISAEQADQLLAALDQA